MKTFKSYLKESDEKHLGTSDIHYRDYQDGAETLNNVKHLLHNHQDLSSDEEQSIGRYTKDVYGAQTWPKAAYRMINTYHRTGEAPSEGWKESIHENTKHLDS